MSEVKDADVEAVLGVGDGSGQLFVRGSYEAIKRVQEMIFELERLTRAPSISLATDVVAKWRADIQAVLDRVPAFAAETGMSQDEAAGREYAWAYALAAMDDLEALAQAPRPMGEELE